MRIHLGPLVLSGEELPQAAVYLMDLLSGLTYGQMTLTPKEIRIVILYELSPMPIVARYIETYIAAAATGHTYSCGTVRKT
jgi:hypothetical protein